MKTTRYLLPGIPFLFPLLLFGQTLQFEHLRNEDGLPDNNVTALLQDSLGFLWIGTRDGLCRYDGRRFRVFRRSPEEAGTLTHNQVNCLAADGEGRLWVGTRRGLNCYLPEGEGFRRYQDFAPNPSRENNYIYSLCTDRRGFVWMGTYDGTFRLNPTTGTFEHFPAEPNHPRSLSGNLVYGFMEDQQGRIWMGTNNGISLYDPEKPGFRQFLPRPGNPLALQTKRVFCFAQQPDGTLWAGTIDGIYRIAETSDGFEFHRLPYQPGRPDNLSYNYISDLFADSNDRLWAATWDGGLNELRFPESGKHPVEYRHHRAHPDQPHSLSHDEVQTVMRDRSGILWVGTAAGLDKAAPTSLRFPRITHQPTNPNSLSHAHVNAILQDSRGNLWIGTRGGGLNLLRAPHSLQHAPSFESFRHHPLQPHTLPHDNIYGLDEDSRGNLWIATYDGLAFTRPSSDGDPPRFYTFNTASRGPMGNLPHKFVFGVLEIAPDTFWVATYGKLAKMIFNPRFPEKSSFHWFDMDPARNDALVNATTYILRQDRFGQVWVGTFYGLSKILEDEQGTRFENYLHDPADSSSLSDNYINDLFLDSRGRFWAATNNGLNLFLQSSPDDSARFRSFGVREGLPSEAIHSIESDAKGLLWLGTNKGLALFDPDSALQGRGGVRAVYTFLDGLQGNEFNDRASFRDAEGRLYFGGKGGLNHFFPRNLPRNERPPKVVFTELKLFNQTVLPGHSALLPRSITLAPDLLLRHHQNVLSIEFSALDLSQPAKNHYAYRLEGFDPDWVFSGNHNSATYTNLPPGHYTFRVKATNNDGVWSSTPAALSIEVLPPPWRSWWAYTLYGLAFLAALYAFTRRRIERRVRQVKRRAAIERARFEERELLRKKNAADFHDELGHRLTKISLYLELAERQILPDEKTLRAYLKKVKAQTAELSTGIRDLIWSLDPQKDSLFDTLNRLQEFGDQLFDHSGISFQTHGLHPSLLDRKLQSDTRKQVLLLFKEAMNNTLKHASARHAVLSTHTLPDGTLVLLFRDDGCGFDPEETPSGYGLRNMKTRASKAGGRLQIRSSPGEGTQLALHLPPLKPPT
ncbi:MAG: hypothetical protein D6765_04370, partial [Bacteroidetes bacterium]